MDILTWSSEEIKQIKKYAEDNPISNEEIMDCLKNKKSINICPKQSIAINNILIAYTIDTHSNGKMKHLSLTIEKGKLVSKIFVTLICDEFGYKDFDNAIISTFNSNEHLDIVDIFEPFEKTWDEYNKIK